MPEWVYVVAFLVFLAPVGIAAAAYFSVLALSKAKARPARPEAHRAEYAKARQYDDWAQGEGFEWLGGYLIEAGNRIFIGAWQHAEQSVYFCVYCHSLGTAFDLVTYFCDDVTLTTGSSKDGQMLPPHPGAFMQTFPGKSPEELWDRHLLAEAFLSSQMSVTAKPEDRPFDQVFTEAAHRQVAYVRSIPLWPLRAIYWYLVRRSRLAGKSIQDQHEAGLIDFRR